MTEASRQDNIAAFVAYCEERLTPAEGAALLLASAGAKGVQWSLPKEGLVWSALEHFCLERLTDEDVQRYARAIEKRLDKGSPAVAPALVSGIVWPTVRHRRNGSPTPRVARDYDEFLDQQAQAARDKARRAHVRNQQTERYASLRDEALAAAGYRCECCGSEEPLQLHHKHYANLGCETLQDLQMLCDSCHLKVTERQRALRRARWKPWSAGHSAR